MLFSAVTDDSHTGKRAGAGSGSHQRPCRGRFLNQLDGAWDALSSSDPGLNRLFQACELVVAIGVSITAIYGFMQLTHVMWLSAPTGASPSPTVAARLTAQHHEITLLAMVLAGVIGLLSVFAVTEPRLRQQALTLTLAPIPVLGTMALAIWLLPRHEIGVVVLALVMGLGTYLRKGIPRFGPRMFLFGAEMFVGYIFGFLNRGAIKANMLGWIAVILVIACALNLLVKVGVARPMARRRLARISVAFRARGRAVMSAAVALFDASRPRDVTRAQRRLRHALLKLNETALVIDASLAGPDNARDTSSRAARTELFDLELLIQELGRLSERLATAELPAAARGEVRELLVDLRLGELSTAVEAARELESWSHDGWLADCDAETTALVHRFIHTLVATDEANRHWPRHHARQFLTDDSPVSFESPVTLVFGDLPGSAMIGARAADDAREGRSARLGLDPSAQAAIRMAVAVGAAAGIGSVLSEQHFYWAVIAVFITFMGTSTSGEQVAKAVNRVAGTLVGVLLGSLLAEVIGVSTWSILVIVGTLALGIYFMKVSYAVMVIGITVAICQLYEQLEVFSSHMLALRLEEAAVGAVVAVTCALVIFPLPTRRVAHLALQGYLSALTDLLERARVRLVGEGAGDHHDDLTGAARALDHANQQLIATAKPLRLTPVRRDRLEHNVALFSVSAHQARNLAAQIERHGPYLAPLKSDELAAALAAERDSSLALAMSLAEPERPEPARRLGDRHLAAMEDALDDDRVAPHDHRRRLLVSIERLDASLFELRQNLVPSADRDEARASA